MGRPLKIYMRGERVKQLQQLLKRHGHEISDQPGLFGTGTRAAVKLLQQEHGLEATGIADDALMAHIGTKLEPQPDTTAQDSNADTNTATLQAQLDALTQLLLQKGVISAEELNELLSAPTSTSTATPSEPPSSQAPGVIGSPLF
jgi:peptidoglycan hydrolase-like protein with peptidoglycan-binding domain